MSGLHPSIAKQFADISESTLSRLEPSGGVPLFYHGDRPIWGGSTMTGIEVFNLMRSLDGSPAPNYSTTPPPEGENYGTS